MIELQEVHQRNSVTVDEYGRNVQQIQSYARRIKLNPNQVESVIPLASSIVESEGESPVALSKIVTSSGKTHIVVGTFSDINKKLFGKGILKG